MIEAREVEAMPWIIFFLSLHLQQPTQWQWPITTKHGVTSSFGEYRGQRFHMGLDFSTGGIEGEPIYPAQNGTVFQVRATRRGYGNVVYVRHPSGHTTVYAHLAAFGPDLEQAIRAKGKKPGSHFGRLNLNLAVTTKTLLAYSGESGAGLPHLHFEVRDSQNRALDPLDLNFPAIPTLGKRVKLLEFQLTPLDSHSEVNGNPWPIQVPPGVSTVQAKGNIGLIVKAHIQGARSSKLGLRGLKVSRQGQPLANWLPRRIDYQNHRTAGTIFDQALSGFGPTTYAYVVDNRHRHLPKPEQFKTPTPLNITKRETFEIALMDQVGNWHRFHLTLDPKATPASKPLPLLKATQPTSLGLYAHGLNMTFSSATLKGQLNSLSFPEVVINPNQPHRIQLPVSLNPESWTWNTDQGKLARRIATFPSQKTYQIDLKPFQIRSSNGSSVPKQALWLEPAKTAPYSQVLDIQSPILRFGLEGWPTSGLEVALNVKGHKRLNQLGLYQFSKNSGRWRWQAREKNGLIRHKLTGFHPLVLAADIKKPTIGKPKLHRYFSGKRIVIPVKDLGSGIDSKTLSLTKAGNEVPFEYDPDRRWIIIPKEQKGPWNIAIADKAGNQTILKGLNF